MTEQASSQIQALKQRYQVETDEQLAEKFGIGRSTIASWRRRDKVPARYLLRSPGDEHESVSITLMDWTPEEQNAFRLALFRSSRKNPPSFKSYEQFLTMSNAYMVSFLLEFDDARNDLKEEMVNAPSLSPSDAAALIAYRDCQSDNVD